jgi:adenylate cyclase
MQSSHVGRVFEFGGFTLDLVRGCLLAGDRQIDVRPKSFDVLHYLLQNPGRLVSKDELVNAVWPNTFVTDDALTHCVSEVRGALGDSDQRIIKTVPRRGYLFLAPVSSREKDVEPPILPVTASPSSPMHANASPKVASIDAARSRTVADIPSVAVLPFQNMSGDHDQDYFADGIVDEITTALSRFKSVFVIARNSSFTYKGKVIDIKRVGRELAVEYVLEGSVRKAGNRIRVTVQLIDAETDGHIWAERYDRELEDIFAIQDELTCAIVATLTGRVEAATHDRAKRKPTTNMVAYECVLTARVLHHRSSREDNAEAQRLLDRALALDPNYAHAHAWKACVLGQTWTHNWCADRDCTLQQLAAELEIALALDDGDSDVHRILAALNQVRKDHGKAMYHQERALALNPNHDLVVVQQGEFLTWLGRPEEGIEWIKKAMRLNPYHPERFWGHLGRACYCAEKYAEAAQAFSRISRPNHTHHAFLAATFAQMGNAVAAAAHAAEVLKREPQFSAAVHLATQDYKREADRLRHEAGLLKAGLPV